MLPCLGSFLGSFPTVNVRVMVSWVNEILWLSDIIIYLLYFSDLAIFPEPQHLDANLLPASHLLSEFIFGATFQGRQTGQPAGD